MHPLCWDLNSNYHEIIICYDTHVEIIEFNPDKEDEKE